jgi:hypothetical protein
MKNAGQISVTLGTMPEAKPYTVKLYFAEPDNLPAGKRIFHVDIDGKRVLSDFDIAKEAGGAGRTIIKEFHGIPTQGNIVVRLTPAAGATVRVTVICGLELIAEDRK